MERLSENSPYFEFETYLERVTDAEAGKARIILLKDHKAFKDILRNGGVSQKRLDELANSATDQTMYSWIIRMKENGGKDAYEASQTIENLSKDVYAGFLAYKRKYYEEKLGVKLISDFDD